MSGSVERPVRVLLVEDDPSLRRVLAYHLEREGHAVEIAADGREGLDLLDSKTFDLVLTDVRMPRMDGRELLAAVRERDADLPVVVMTAFGTIQDAVEAMQGGASDYLTKPVDREHLLMAVKKALRLRDLQRENRRLRTTLARRRPLEGIVGSSAVVREVVETIERVAPTDATVLITGETGTGKELVARALHDLSPRASKPFVALNCAAVPRDLLESELFGHERGAFTGAVESKPGKILSAAGGTLFLDEIGDMAVGLQAKILRTLQERVVDPVGAKKPRPVDVRLLAATHQDLQDGVREGTFREDLYWRLNVIPIHVPPLRERGEDVLLLFTHFYREAAGIAPAIEEPAARRLLAYAWPGNVRELQSLCQRLAILHPGRPVAEDLLPRELMQSDGGDSAEGLWALEREAIARALRESGGNRSAAARALRIPRHVLLYRIKKFGIGEP